MNADKTSTLVSRLYDRTVEGNVEWELGPLSDTYIADLSAYSVRLGKTMPDSSYGMTTGDTEPTFTLQIRQKDKILEEINSSLQSVTELLPFLYEEARRRATHSDTAIDDLLSVLDK